MTRTCKHYEQNQKERKCNDYFISHSKGGAIMCRLTEWKQKCGICPYDNTIQSIRFKKKLPKEQTTLK